MGCLLSVRGAADKTLASMRKDFAFLCRITAADCQQNDRNVVGKMTALCQQFVSISSWQHLIFLMAG
jgi:hypothetical protein